MKATNLEQENGLYSIIDPVAFPLAPSERVGAAGTRSRDSSLFSKFYELEYPLWQQN